MRINTQFNYTPHMYFRGIAASDSSADSTTQTCNDDFPSESDILDFIEAGVDLRAVDPNTGDTLMHEIVKHNYVPPICRILQKYPNAQEIINTPNLNKESPLDVAQSPEMVSLLTTLGAKSLRGSVAAADAKVVAARQFMSKPVSDVVAEKLKTEETVPDTDIEPADPVNEPENSLSEEPKTDSSDNEVPNFDDLIEEVPTEDVPSDEVQPEDVQPEDVPTDEVPSEDTSQVASVGQSVSAPITDKELLSAAITGETNPSGEVGEALGAIFGSGAQVRGVAPGEALKISISTDGSEQDIQSYDMTQNGDNPQDIPAFDDLIGLSDVKKDLRANIIEPLKNKAVSDRMKANNVDLPNGILFISKGGELTLIRAMAKEANLPLIPIEDPTHFPKILAHAQAEYKKTGRKQGVLALGFDKFFPGQNQNGPAANAFKNRLKGIKDKGVLFIATSPERFNVPCDFMQSGIIDKIVEIPMPNEDDSIEFFKKYFENRDIFKGLSEEESINHMASLTENMSFSDITRVLEEAARTTVSRSLDSVTDEIFMEELNDFSKESGRTEINDFNRTAGLDSPDLPRVPVKEGEMMNLDELAGLEKIKEQLRKSYIEPMKHFDEYSKVFKEGEIIPDGAIFYGPPGNGKTITAKVFARELGLPFYELKLSEFGTSLVHETAKELHKRVQPLKDKYEKTGEMSVLFIDEFDGMGGNRNGDGQVDRELANALLQEFTSPSKSGIILILATNYIEDIDAALKRPGRSDERLYFGNPNEFERKDLISKTLSRFSFTKEYLSDEDFVNKLVKDTDGLSFASISKMLIRAARDTFIYKEDFKTAINKRFDAALEQKLSDLSGTEGLKQYEYTPTDLTFDEIGGMDEVKRQLQEGVIDMWDPELRNYLISCKMEPPGGFILYGPSGTGKTTLVKALARKMDVPLYIMDYNQEGNEYIHQVSKHIHEIFENLSIIAKIRKGPVMLFFDEVERFIPRHAERHQIEEVNTYKEAMNTASLNGIILAGATNTIEKVDEPTISNSLRMGQQIYCGAPDANGRRDIFSRLLENCPILSEKISDSALDQLVEMTPDFTQSDIKTNVRKLIIKSGKNRETLDSQAFVDRFSSMIGAKNNL